MKNVSEPCCISDLQYVHCHLYALCVHGTIKDAHTYFDIDCLMYVHVCAYLHVL